MTDVQNLSLSATSRPVILDLFCCAGGAAMGYHRAGFDVVGVDIKPQPNYPFEFHRCDALEALDRMTTATIGMWLALDPKRFAAVHASPPCQWKTAYARRPNHVGEYPNLIAPVRELLTALGLPYVIENVEYARDHLHDPIRLCGSSFGLDVRRHRLFECTFPIQGPDCDHAWQTPRFPPATNRTNLRSTVEVGVWRIPLDVQQRAMGINWTTLHELSEAIPPAYTQYIGHHLMAHLMLRSPVLSPTTVLEQSGD